MTIGCHRIHRETTEYQEEKSLKIEIRICVLIICAFMKFIDITTDTQTLYRLEKDEKAVFFLFNRSGDITFELLGDRSEAHIVALFLPNIGERITSRISQIHQGANTRSSFTGRSLLSEKTGCDWQGLLSIKSSAPRSDAHQEMKHLLLSPEAEARSLPSLEIEQNDVRCGHAATMSAPDPEQIFFLESRGFTRKQSEALIAQGFVSHLMDVIATHAEAGLELPDILKTSSSRI